MSKRLRLLFGVAAIAVGAIAAAIFSRNNHPFPKGAGREAASFAADALRRARLEANGGYTLEAIKHSAFAVHPGGPKIIDRVRDVLELRDPQVAISRDMSMALNSPTRPSSWWTKRSRSWREAVTWLRSKGSPSSSATAPGSA